MLNAGNITGTIKNAFSDMLILRFGKEKRSSLFTLYPITANTMNAILNEINRGTVNNGVLYPRPSDKLFIDNPKNIKREMLSPTDKTVFSVSPSLFSFRMERMRNPGIMEKKVSPKTCLKRGMFRKIERSVARKNTNNKKNLLALDVFSNSIILTFTQKLAQYLPVPLHCLLEGKLPLHKSTGILGDLFKIWMI